MEFLADKPKEIRAEDDNRTGNGVNETKIAVDDSDKNKS